MTGGLSIETGGPELASLHRTDICRLHYSIFSAPPFVTSISGVEQQMAVFDDLLEKDAFTVSIARAGEMLIGFAYGHRLPVDHLWWGRFLVDIPQSLTDEWEGRTFTLVDLAVDERHRREGLGRRLVQTLLAGRREERVILSTQPSADDAHAFYSASGWQLIGRKGPIPGAVPPFWDIYLREIRPDAE